MLGKTRKNLKRKGLEMKLKRLGLMQKMGVTPPISIFNDSFLLEHQGFQQSPETQAGPCASEQEQSGHHGNLGNKAQKARFQRYCEAQI